MEIGFNLYSIRNQVQTADQLRDAFVRLKGMGYEAVQFSGTNYDPELLRTLSAEVALPVVLTHMPLERLLHDRDGLIREHERFGCRNIGLGMMPGEIASDDERVKKLTEELEDCAVYLKKFGFTLYYHNHSFEFRHMAGQTVYDYLIENTSALCFVPDTYWLQHGGVNIVEYIHKLKGRCACAHLKDYTMEGWTPRYAPVGEGNIDFVQVLKELAAAGTRHYIVEQDNATESPDPFGEAYKSVSFLKKIQLG